MDLHLTPSTEEWIMGIPQAALTKGYVEKQLVWIAVKDVPHGISDIETLYGWANKAFNWLKKPENCLGLCMTKKKKSHRCSLL
jgi:hypothetical protein